MSRFEVASTTLWPDDRPDAVGEGVVWSLIRPLDNVPPWSPRRAIVGGAWTAGILPAVAWPRGWNDFLTMEREVFESMIRWADARSARDGPIPARVFPWNRRASAKPQVAMGRAVLIVSIVVMLLYFHWWVTAGIVWNAALSVLFFRLAMRIHRRHRADTRWVVRQLYKIARAENVNIRLLETDGKFTVGRHWFFVGLFLSLLAQPWGMTYALAGALRQRAIREDAPAVRNAMAVACRTLYLHWNPGAFPPGPTRLGIQDHGMR